MAVGRRRLSLSILRALWEINVAFKQLVVSCRLSRAINLNILRKRIHRRIITGCFQEL